MTEIIVTFRQFLQTRLKIRAIFYVGNTDTLVLNIRSLSKQRYYAFLQVPVKMKSIGSV